MITFQKTCIEKKSTYPSGWLKWKKKKKTMPSVGKDMERVEFSNLGVGRLHGTITLKAFFDIYLLKLNIPTVTQQFLF